MSFEAIPFEELDIEELDIEELESRLEMANSNSWTVGITISIPLP